MPEKSRGHSAAAPVEEEEEEEEEYYGEEDQEVEPANNMGGKKWIIYLSTKVNLLLNIKPLKLFSA